MAYCASNNIRYVPKSAASSWKETALYALENFCPQRMTRGIRPQMNAQGALIKLNQEAPTPLMADRRLLTRWIDNIQICFDVKTVCPTYPQEDENPAPAAVCQPQAEEKTERPAAAPAQKQPQKAKTHIVKPKAQLDGGAMTPDESVGGMP